MKLNLSKPICFFDLETTGVNISKDRIVEISILKVFPSGKEEIHTWLVNPEINIPDEVVAMGAALQGELLLAEAGQSDLVEQGAFPIVEIKDVGKSMKTGGRYHETKEGGSHHTDSPQWKDVPDYLSLFCVHNAKKGGTNLFLSAYTIHNKILNNIKIKFLYFIIFSLIFLQFRIYIFLINHFFPYQQSYCVLLFLYRYF